LFSGVHAAVCLLLCFWLQLPTQGAVTTLIAAPQGVLRNFYPMKGGKQQCCTNINRDSGDIKSTASLLPAA
jgi:hypothetical protein